MRPGEAYPFMRWCPDCGAVQPGATNCYACGALYQGAGPLGFEDLYAAYADPLGRFVRRLAAERGLPESLVDAEGVVHDTFVVLLSGSGQPIRSPAAWLFAVARNQLSKAAAAQRRIAPGDPADHLHHGGAAWTTLTTPPADAEDIRAAREVMHAIAKLPSHQKIATYLHQVQGWSLAETGAYLDCAATTAGVHSSRGTARVRSDLSGPFGLQVGDGNYITFNYGGYSPGTYGDHPPWPLLPGPPVPWRRTRRRTALMAAVGLVGLLLATAAAHALGMSWWLAAVTAAAAGVASLSAVAVVRWWLREKPAARRRQPQHHRRLKADRALNPPDRPRRP
jgi:DNA-directed RNA polymerase specialized sigma24 family protein